MNVYTDNKCLEIWVQASSINLDFFKHLLGEHKKFMIKFDKNSKWSDFPIYGINIKGINEMFLISTNSTYEIIKTYLQFVSVLLCALISIY